jgi:threonine dehydratase
VAALTYEEIEAAAERIGDRVRRVVVAKADPGVVSAADAAGRGEVYLALEFMQHTGTFKARGQLNLLRAQLEVGTLPDAGVTIASGGNAGLACAWAAQDQGVPATVFVPATAPQVKIAGLKRYGADVRLVGSQYAEALTACQDFATTTGALTSHAYDHPLVAAGAGTLLDEIRNQIPALNTVVVAVGGGGLFAGVATAAQQHGIQTVAIEPENSRALNAALDAGRVVDVMIDSIAADSLGARRTSEMALHAAQHQTVQSVLVSDTEIIAARQTLWDHCRLAVEHAAGAALAGVLGAASYRPSAGERVCVVLCGANTDPADLVQPSTT